MTEARSVLGLRRLAAALFGHGAAPARRRRYAGEAAGAALRTPPPIVAVAILVLLSMAEPASACTVCMGAPDDPMTQGVSRGVWVLLSIIFAVQIGFVALFWSFRKRARDLKKFREQFRVVDGGSR